MPADRIQQTSSVASTSLNTLITSAVFLPYDSVTGPCFIFSRARSLIAATSALKVLVMWPSGRNRLNERVRHSAGRGLTRRQPAATARHA